LRTVLVVLSRILGMVVRAHVNTSLGGIWIPNKRCASASEEEKRNARTLLRAAPSASFEQRKFYCPGDDVVE
jgi:hypothetical protein